MTEQNRRSVEGNQINIEGEVHGPVVGGNVDQIGDRAIHTGGGDYTEQSDSDSGKVGQIGSRTIDTGGGNYFAKVVNVFVSIPPLVRYAILTAASLLGLIALYLLYPYAEPLWNQWDMTGDFNIAVVDFGIRSADGRIQSNEFAAGLSTSIATQLENAYQTVKEEEDFPLHVLVWHNGRGRAEGKNVRFPVFDGKTAEERAAQAQILVDEIHAQMVIYGYLTEATNPESLVLEFYYQGQVRAGEPNAMWGSYELGTPVSAPVSYRLNPETAQRRLVQRLAPRMQAIFRISQALAELLADNPHAALTIMQNAERSLAATWPEKEGKEVLYLFTGTAAFYAQEFATAITALDEALRINSAYVPALDMLGSVYIQQAAFSQFRGLELGSEQLACYSPAAISASDPDRTTALASTQTAIGLLEQAAELAPTWHWQPYIYRVNMDLGYAYQLRGLWELNEDFARAEKSLDAAEAQFQAALTGFPPETQAIYHARTQVGLAIVDNIRAYMSQRRRDSALDKGTATEAASAEAASYAAAATTQLEGTIAHYQRCLDMGSQPQAAGSPYYLHSIVQCVCAPNQERARQTLAKLQEAENE